MTNPIPSIAHALATLADVIDWAVTALGWWLAAIVLAWPLIKRVLWAMTPAYEFGKRMGVRKTGVGMFKGSWPRMLFGRVAK